MKIGYYIYIKRKCFSEDEIWLHTLVWKGIVNI